MKTIIALAFCGLLAAGCGDRFDNVKAPDTPAKIVYNISLTHNAMLVGMVAYESQPRCDQTESPICSDRDVVDLLRKADTTADSAITAAELTVRAHPELNADFAIAAAQNAISAMEQILSQYNIKWGQ